MHDYAVLPPNCVGEGDCGSPSYAFAIFIIFYVVCTFIFVNLFTVVSCVPLYKNGNLLFSNPFFTIRLSLIIFHLPLTREINLRSSQELI